MSCSNNLKQLGLATHNFHDANGYLPPWGFDFNYQPNPASPLNPVYPPPQQGHSALTQILPYIEQDNVYRIGHIEFSVIDPANWPPNWGTALSGPSKIKTFVCPSSPDRVIDYEPYFAGSLHLPDKGPFPLGLTDYAPIRGQVSTFTSACAPASPADTDSNNGVGALGVRGLINTTGWSRGKLKITDMSDGTSNTLMFGEDSGRHQIYAKRTPVQPNAPGTAGWSLNAAWSDYNTAIRVHGYSNDGLVQDGGCCVINCSNNSQLFAFHSGGVNTLRGDGSVHFLSDSIAPGVLAALVTRAGGEVFNDQ
jgi:hypothetical protein